MAEIVRIEGQEFKKRNIWAVWLGLPIITLGIYTFVWYYKINDEARRYLRDDSIRPGISLLAVLLGWVLIVPPFISVYRTAERVKRMQVNAGVRDQIEPVLALLGVFVASLWTLYMQYSLNKVWDLYLGAPALGPRETGAPLPAPSGQATPPPFPAEPSTPAVPPPPPEEASQG